MVILVFLSFSLLGGCGQSQSADHPKGHGQNHGNGGFAAGEIQTWITYKQQDSKLHFTFHLKNQTEQVKTFHFNTGQRYDFVIKNDQGKKILQYSDDKMFTQMVGQETLKQAEELTYDAEVSDLEKGHYTITFWLTAKNEQPRASKSFQVK